MEPLTNKGDNYAHFILEDCELLSRIAKLLIASEQLDLRDLRKCIPEKGQVLAAPHGRLKTYSIVIKKSHNEELDWDEVSHGLKNFLTALRRDKQTTCRIANSRDLLSLLPQNEISEELSKVISRDE